MANDFITFNKKDITIPLQELKNLVSVYNQSFTILNRNDSSYSFDLNNFDMEFNLIFRFIADDSGIYHIDPTIGIHIKDDTELSMVTVIGRIPAYTISDIRTFSLNSEYPAFNFLPRGNIDYEATTGPIGSFPARTKLKLKKAERDQITFTVKDLAKDIASNLISETDLVLKFGEKKHSLVKEPNIKYTPNYTGMGNKSTVVISPTNNVASTNQNHDNTNSAKTNSSYTAPIIITGVIIAGAGTAYAFSGGNGPDDGGAGGGNGGGGNGGGQGGGNGGGQGGGNGGGQGGGNGGGQGGGNGGGQGGGNGGGQGGGNGGGQGGGNGGGQGGGNGGGQGGGNGGDNTFGNGRYPGRDRHPPKHFIDNLNLSPEELKFINDGTKQIDYNKIGKELTDSLTKKGFKITDVIGNGDCFFEAMALQMPQYTAANLRELTAQYIIDHASNFEESVHHIDSNLSATDYANNLRSSGEWVDTPAVIAFANRFNVNIHMHSNYEIPVISPNTTSNNHAHLLFTGNHYMSAEPSLSLGTWIYEKLTLTNIVLTAAAALGFYEIYNYRNEILELVTSTMRHPNHRTSPYDEDTGGTLIIDRELTSSPGPYSGGSPLISSHVDTSVSHSPLTRIDEVPKINFQTPFDSESLFSPARARGRLLTPQTEKLHKAMAKTPDPVATMGKSQVTQVATELANYLRTKNYLVTNHEYQAYIDTVEGYMNGKVSDTASVHDIIRKGKAFFDQDKTLGFDAFNDIMNSDSTPAQKIGKLGITPALIRKTLHIDGSHAAGKTKMYDYFHNIGNYQHIAYLAIMMVIPSVSGKTLLRDEDALETGLTDCEIYANEEVEQAETSPNIAIYSKQALLLDPNDTPSWDMLKSQMTCSYTLPQKTNVIEAEIVEEEPSINPEVEIAEEEACPAMNINAPTSLDKAILAYKPGTCHYIAGTLDSFANSLGIHAVVHYIINQGSNPYVALANNAIIMPLAQSMLISNACNKIDQMLVDKANSILLDIAYNNLEEELLADSAEQKASSEVATTVNIELKASEITAPISVEKAPTAPEVYVVYKTENSYPNITANSYFIAEQVNGSLAGEIYTPVAMDFYKASVIFSS